MLSLIERLAASERRFAGSRFLAPQVHGGEIRVRIEGLIQRLRSNPKDFEGWGVFQALEAPGSARLLSEAPWLQVESYLKLMPRIRMILVQPLNGKSWLALPANRSDALQRLDRFSPVTVHLVRGAQAFQQVSARFDGTNLWFESLDRRADPTVSGRLAQAARSRTRSEELRFSSCTPELRQAYDMVFRPAPEADQRPRIRCSEQRLRKALRDGGGELRGFIDQGDFWTVRWVTGEGEEHTSAIGKSDLTVVSSGICLSGEDQRFDLQSLVGVIEQRE